MVGVWFTTATVDAAELVHPATVTVTEYVPPWVVNALVVTVGFCTFDANPNGPVQLYVAFDTLLAVKLNVPPLHTAPLLPTVGALGAPGSLKVTGPTATDEQLFELTTILL